jgi:hypothetical protein
VVFIDLYGDGARFQVTADPRLPILERIWRGDYVGVEGPVVKTQRGTTQLRPSRSRFWLRQSSRFRSGARWIGIRHFTCGTARWRWCLTCSLGGGSRLGPGSYKCLGRRCGGGGSSRSPRLCSSPYTAAPAATPLRSEGPPKSHRPRTGHLDVSR